MSYLWTRARYIPSRSSPDVYEACHCPHDGPLSFPVPATVLAIVLSRASAEEVYAESRIEEGKEDLVARNRAVERAEEEGKETVILAGVLRRDHRDEIG